MRKLFFFIALACLTGTAFASADTVKVDAPLKERLSLKPDSAFMALSLKQRFFYGYNFDIYFHHDTRDEKKSNGVSLSLTPEFGYKFSQKANIGLRFGGSYSSERTDYPIGTVDGATLTRNIRVSSGAWEIMPYGRFRLKTLFNDKVGIWLEARLFTRMEYPRVTDGDSRGTDYDGLKHTIQYGAQVSPVITYQFNRKSTFQVFFSILSLGYSGSAFCYDSAEKGAYKEYTNDLIIFSGKLRNLIANQFTPGLYGLKIGVQKSF